MLEDFADGDPAIIGQMAATILRKMSEAIDKAKAALGADSLREVADLAHSSIGSSGVVGLNDLVPTLRELEQAARKGRVADSARLLSDWERQFDSVREVLESLVQTPEKSNEQSKKQS